MQQKIQTHLDQVLNHLYINPLEKCNLKCKICYTRKTSPILSENQIIEFIDRYRQHHTLQTVTFCGGEVFALAYYPHLVNTLVSQGIFVQMITNGTIDKLDQLENPNMINLIVSIDGLQESHDANRGEGNFEKSINFLKKAGKRGFHREIFSIVTKQNMPQIDSFEAYLEKELDERLSITYHPRKPPAYLLHNPNANVFGQVQNFDFLSKEEMLKVITERNVFPPKDLGCYQIALTSDGRVFGCCEGVRPIGKMDEEILTLFKSLEARLEKWESSNKWEKCLGCSEPGFMCGIKQYLEISNAIQ